jgi:hypothetical protein
LAYWKKKENVYYAEILRDMNSFFDANFMQLSTLIEGKRMFGKYAVLRFVMENAKWNSYNELNKLLVLLTGSELSLKPNVSSSENTKS